MCLIIRRGWMWQLRTIELTGNEVRAFVGRNAFDNEILRKYLVWRKSCLLMAAIVLSVTAFFSIVGFAAALFVKGEFSWEIFNGFGKLAQLSMYLAPVVLATAAWVSFFYWIRKPYTSFLALSYGWIISLFMTLWPMVMPIHFFINGGFDSIFRDFDDVVATYLTFGFRALVAFQYAISALPVIVTIPSGIIRGSLRIRGLLPECSLAGWLIVITSPLYPLVALMAVVQMSQLAGNFLLVVGAAFYLVAPSLYIFRRKLYTKPNLTAQQISQVNWNQRIIGGLSLVGLLLIGIWCLTAADMKLTFMHILRFFLSFLSNQFCNTVVFADMVFRMTVDSLSADAIANENTVGLLHQLGEDFHEIRNGSNNRKLPKNDLELRVPEGSTTETKLESIFPMAMSNTMHYAANLVSKDTTDLVMDPRNTSSVQVGNPVAAIISERVVARDPSNGSTATEQNKPGQGLYDFLPQLFLSCDLLPFSTGATSASSREPSVNPTSSDQTPLANNA